MNLNRMRCTQCKQWVNTQSETSSVCEICINNVKSKPLPNYSDPARQKAVRHVIATIKELETKLTIYQTLLKELTK